MKINTVIVSLFLLSVIGIASAIDENNNMSVTNSLDVVVQPIKKCACGPTEHWFYKSIVKKYIAEHSDSGLLENNDTEGLSENIVEAINLLACDIQFVDDSGVSIVPELNAKGKLFLPLSRNSDYKLCKEILRNVDVATTLTVQELYQQWSKALITMKSSQ